MTVTGGEGTVAAIATVVDLSSNSFSAVRGHLFNPSDFTTIFLPMAVAANGMNDTVYSTSLSVMNPQNVAMVADLTYHYKEVASPETMKAVTKTITLPARGALVRDVGANLVRGLFGVTAPSYGWVQFANHPREYASNMVALAAIRSAVDPHDAHKGYKIAQVNAFDAAPLGMRFAGCERSLQKRTNLILVNSYSTAGSVLVKLSSADGTPLGQREFPIASLEYKQIDDVFAAVGLGEGEYQDVEVTAEPRGDAASPFLSVFALATVIDNLSKNPEVFVLGPLGPPRK